MSQANFYLLFKQVEIKQANAISSPLTYGFPAIGGFVGAIHNLSRKMQAYYPDAALNGVLIACNHYQLQAYRPHRYADYTFNQTRNPLLKDGSSPAFVEEGKIHLTVSLVVEVSVSEDLQDTLKDQQQAEDFTKTLSTLLLQQRIAGGSVFRIGNTKLFPLSSSNEITRQLQPAFVLMDAKQDLIAITKELQTGIKHQVLFNEVCPMKNEQDQPVLSHYSPNPKATALDALFEVACLHHIPTKSEKNTTTWDLSSVKEERGWLVPIPIGYQGIYPPFQPNELQHCRNPQYPSQYVEAIYSLGKWVFPYRLKDQFEQCFWHYTTPEENLYLYQQGA
ncbi:type I-F CRISPR-associated protein Csy2 [Gallibacterium salpingitidis]|uniref:CRISPR-associated protein n=1 Tax=Gallibacterium salpingitidis TaxID=505341 RepID=A0A1A7P2T4_9PAST|nr:type I-F CRISPR-associated protein Csy2 [Gallibacterium salpingitidis]OBW95534.1 CRISPR-associated protein [Gallibacterium salpingitidis]